MRKKIFLALAVVFGLWAADLNATSRDFSADLEFMGQAPDGRVSRLARLLGRGLGAYDSLRDYTAVFQKSEFSNGKMAPEESIYFKFEKPFKIFMGWLNTHKKGLQVVYERGRHKGKLAIHKPGLFLGLAPVVFLDQNSPWLREGSASYDIEDAGIGSFVFDFTKAVLAAWRGNRLGVTFPNPTDVYTADVTFDVPGQDETYFAKRVVVRFDEKTGLPVQMRLYDWQDQLIGAYAYEDLKLNVEQDQEFRNQINRHLLKVYESHR